MISATSARAAPSRARALHPHGVVHLGDLFLDAGAALLVLDVDDDTAREAPRLVLALNRAVTRFAAAALPVVVTRRTPRHPAHALALPPTAEIVSREHELGAFWRTDLDERLRRLGVRQLFVGGSPPSVDALRETVIEALRLGYRVAVLVDALRAMSGDPTEKAQVVRELIMVGAEVVEIGPHAPGAELPP